MQCEIVVKWERSGRYIQCNAESKQYYVSDELATVKMELCNHHVNSTRFNNYTVTPVTGNITEQEQKQLDKLPP
jgi:hypothetical protein